MLRQCLYPKDISLVGYRALFGFVGSLQLFIFIFKLIL